jgi:hypothetical protein
VQATCLLEDAGQVVQDRVQVGDAHPPDVGEAGVVEPDAVAPGVQVRGLDDDEPVGSPPVDEGPVAVHRPGVAVGEDDDRQAVAVDGRCHPDVQVAATAAGGDGEGLDRDQSAVGECGGHSRAPPEVPRICQTWRIAVPPT